MTPDDFIQKLGELVAARLDDEVLTLTERHFRDLAPSMSPEQIVHNADIAHMAQMAVDLKEWDDTRNEAGTGAAPARRS
jgi:hypothetical protein